MSNEVIEASELFYPSTEESEPLGTPTDEAVEDTPVEEEETEEVDNTETVESNEPEGSEEEASEDDESEDSNVVDAERLMAADYTQKTQALAEDRRALEAEKTALGDEKSKLLDLSAQLEVLVGEDNAIDWAELKEEDPIDYIKQKEKADARKAKLNEVKSTQSKGNAVVLSKDEIAAESNDLFESQGWSVGGVVDEAKHKADMDMMLKYMGEAGYTDQEFKDIQFSHQFKTVLDAARYNIQKGKTSALKKKVKNAPKATKPTTAKKSIKKSAEEVFYGN